MANYNRVILVGNLTKDPELKYIKSGAAIVNMGIAINRKWTGQNGRSGEEVCYVNVIVWQKQAENAAKYLSKGSLILVEGRLQSRSWETDDGQRRSKLEVVAERVQFLPSKHRKDEGEEPEPELELQGDNEGNVPF